MAVSNRSSALRVPARACAALLTQLIALGAGTGHAAQPPALDATFAWSADVLSSDFRSDTLDLSGNVRVTQGPMSIEAGTATAQNLRADRSRWTFQEAVHIRTDQADLKSSSAHASFAQGQIVDARIEGSPAEFMQLGGRADQQVRGRAGVIEYDVIAGVVTLSNQVWFSNGKDEFRGDVVIYNIRDERVQINPGGQPSGRVRGIIRPRNQSTQVEEAPERGAETSSGSASGTVARDLENGA